MIPPTHLIAVQSIEYIWDAVVQEPQIIDSSCMQLLHQYGLISLWEFSSTLINATDQLRQFKMLISIPPCTNKVHLIK